MRIKTDLGFLLGLALSVACAAPSAFAQQVGTNEKPLTIATGRFHGFLPAYRVVDELNEQGIVAELIEFPSATERLEAVVAGYAQVSYAGLTASVLLRARGKDVVVVASTNEKGRGLVGRSDIADVKALKGKSIGVTFGSIEQMTLIALLRKNGLEPNKDVTLINMPATDQPLALNGGSIDAYMGFEPWAAFGVQKFGAKLLSYPYDTELGAIDSGIEMEASFIEEYPDLAKAVVKAHINAVKYYRENPAEIVKAGVENYKVPEEIMKASMDNIELTYEINADNIKALAKFQVEMDFITQDEHDKIDWDKFINGSLLVAAEQ